MAKLKAPFLSLGASGQLGKAVVAFPWKGLDCLREYVIPANPRSTAQLVQRAYLTDGVAAWHTANYTDADHVAWNRYAGTLAKIMSGFNAMMKLYLERRLLAQVWHPASQIEVDTPTAVGFDVDVEDSTVGQTFRAIIGTSRTFFPVQVALVDDLDGTYSLTWAGGASGVDYYVQVQEQSGGVWYNNSGIYHVKSA